MLLRVIWDMKQNLTKLVKIKWHRLLTNGGKFQILLTNNICRSQYDHPSVVTKSRRKGAITMQDDFKDFDNMDQILNDANVKNLYSPTKNRRISSLFHFSPYEANKSVVKP